MPPERTGASAQDLLDAAGDLAPAAYSEGFDDVVAFCLPAPDTGEVHLPVAAPGGGLAHPRPLPGLWLRA